MTQSRYADLGDLGAPSTNGALPLSWVDVDLGDALSGDGAPPPTVGARVDGPALFYGAKTNTVFREPESGKGWLVAVAEAQQLTAGCHVMHIDFEDSPHGVAGRLRLLGVDDDVILERFHYKRPDTELGVGAAALAEQAGGMALVVVDGVTEAMALYGLSGDKNTDVAAFHAAVPLPLARAGPAVVTVDHVVKSRENRGRWATGGGHKLALIDGAAYSVETVVPFARGHSGLANVRVAKDRSGHWRRGDVAAELQVTAWPDGGIDVELAASNSYDDDGNFRPTTLMRRVSEWLADHPGEHSTNAVETAVVGKAEGIRSALAQLEREGHITATRAGGATRYEHVRSFADG